MKVSVVVPVYNEENYIVSCLQHIFDQQDPADEVIVVDNNCTDRTIPLAKQFPVKIIHQPVQGMTPARNLGFDTATGTVIARTDADTLVSRDWVKLIKQYFAKDDTLVGLSGPIKFYDPHDVLQVSSLPVKMYFRSIKKMYRQECLFGPNMSIRKSAWIKVRDKICLDDDTVHEDIDLSLHLAEFGKIRFENSLLVLSSPRRWKRLRPYFEYPYRNMKTFRQHHESIFAEGKTSWLVRRILQRKKKENDIRTYSTF